MRILLVEDDELLGDGVRAGLAQNGHAVDWVTDGEEALAALETSEYDALVLDLGLPRVGGLEVLERMRRAGRKTPVVVLTARDTVSARVKGLDSGADDYLVKPFDLAELLARLRAVARRSGGRALSRERLEEKLYGWQDEIASNAVEVHVHHLRRKLGADLIRTIRGVGYMIEKDRRSG